MIALLITAGLLGLVLWSLLFVITGTDRRRPTSARRSVATRDRSGTADVDRLDDAAAPLWTPLDDHQLTRLLKGPSS
jgi:hypothetical protein